MYVWIDVHAPIMNNFEHRGLRIERIDTTVQRCVLNLHRDKKRRREPGSLVTQDAAHKGCCWTFPLNRPSRFLEKFRTQGFLRMESTAVQSCTRKSTEFASGSKTVDENRGDMENFLVTQGSARIEGSAEHSRYT